MNELLNSSVNEELDDLGELSLRPCLLKEFIGQESLKSNLSVFIHSAMLRKVPLDHTLLHGPPGLGKTTLAQIIAQETGASFKPTSASMLNKPADLASLLTGLKDRDVFFIDEIHRLPSTVEEVLYTAMEDFILDIIVGEGPGARSVRLNLAKFTLIGATTKLGSISNPMRDRFGIQLRLEFYTLQELELIVSHAAAKMQFNVSKDGVTKIAQSSRGTPRIGIRILKRVIDFAVVGGAECINSDIAQYALEQLGIDSYGLDKNDRKYLNFIHQNYNGGPVGLETIAHGMSEQKETIEDSIEPYLMQIGYLHRTSRGRMLSAAGIEYINLTQ